MKKFPSLALLALLAALLLPIQLATAQVQITGNLANFDVRYPTISPLPNDLEIVLYGDGLLPSDVVGTYANPQWGPANSITGSTNSDPTSPAFGLNCVVVRYVGQQLPGLVGQLLHFGVRMRPWSVVAHQEVWWTFNGTRLRRPCDPHITWICTSTGWLICIQNPTPVNMYIYGMRHFLVGTANQLPLLAQLNTNIDPAQFGGTWVPDQLPGGVRVFCIPPWCRIYIRVIVTRWRPIIFQLAARNVDEATFPLQGTAASPNPNDFSPTDPTGQHPEGVGTMVIMTGRATSQLPEDLNCDGAVGIPDFNQMRSQFGHTSEDLGQTQ